jgi:hypothetical protein
MKKILLIIGALCVFGMAGSNLIASDWGCQCILCLSNPGGATQYSECKPPIHRLERHLERGGSFPSCDEAQCNGVDMRKGWEWYYPCEEAYGEGFETAYVSRSTREHTFRLPVCRKITGYVQRQVDCWENKAGRLIGCRTVMMPEYDERPMKERSKKRYIEIVTEGQTLGQRYYY